MDSQPLARVLKMATYTWAQTPPLTVPVRLLLNPQCVVGSGVERSLNIDFSGRGELAEKKHFTPFDSVAPNVNFDR